MLNELKFVRGAVAKKSFEPVLTHYKIENHTIRSFNGSMALCCPIALDIDCTPKAIPFFKAIEKADETVSLSMTPAGRLSVKSGSFKAFIPCIEGDTMHVEPEGEPFDIDGAALLKAMKTLKPLISDDASRPWSNGMLINGQSAVATNNVIIMEYWLGTHFPYICNIPSDAVREMVRINEPPIQASLTGSSITFYYEGDKWIRTNLLQGEWPDIQRILNVESNPSPIPEGLFPGLESIKPFVDDIRRVYFKEGHILTSLAEGEGASFELDSLIFLDGIYQIDMLEKLEGVAGQVDFSAYPAPCMFFGDGVRGAIIGMRS